MRNFDLQIRSVDTQNHHFVVSVVQSPAGESTQLEVVLPVFPAQRDNIPRKDQIEFGLALSDAVLPAHLWSLWQRSYGLAGGALRTRIRVTDAASAAIPWELLYDQERASFLALDPNTPVVRSCWLLNSSASLYQTERG